MQSCRLITPHPSSIHSLLSASFLSSIWGSGGGGEDDDRGDKDAGDKASGGDRGVGGGDREVGGGDDGGDGGGDDGGDEGGDGRLGGYMVILLRFHREAWRGWV